MTTKEKICELMSLVLHMRFYACDVDVNSEAGEMYKGEAMRAADIADDLVEELGFEIRPYGGCRMVNK
jgi:hypothetical protein